MRRHIGSVPAKLSAGEKAADAEQLITMPNLDRTSFMARAEQPPENGFVRGLGLLDGTLLVAGNMIGSGIFIVSADIARQLGSPGWLLIVWLLAGVLTLIAALSYGELAAMFPRAGGQYVYLREAFGSLWGFLYGWTLFLVIQTGTIAAVGIAFARFLGVLWPDISPNTLVLDFGLLALPQIGNLALSLSTQQLVAIAATLLLTAINLRGLRAGSLIQDIFSIAKLAALLALIGLGLAFYGQEPNAAIHLADFWTPQVNGEVIAPLTLLIVVGTAMVGALFSADAWNNVGFTGEEMRNPTRNLPLSMALGVGLVIALYLLANLAYLIALPLADIQNAAQDRVAVATARVLMGSLGETLIAIAIMIATFGCMNGMILTGARAYYSIARDGLFFRAAGSLNRHRVPGAALIMQAIWIVVLTLPRTYDPVTDTYSNLYGNLLDYIIFGVLLFYMLTMASLFVLRRTQPTRERPVRAWGYPVLTALYIVAAGAICVALLIAEKTRVNALLGLVVIASGLPAYAIWRRRA
jgi:basic amino acid/polyamine antiporter, APA family